MIIKIWKRPNGIALTILSTVTFLSLRSLCWRGSGRSAASLQSRPSTFDIKCNSIFSYSSVMTISGLMEACFFAFCGASLLYYIILFWDEEFPLPILLLSISDGSSAEEGRSCISIKGVLSSSYLFRLSPPKLLLIYLNGVLMVADTYFIINSFIE